jgi:serine protease Do
MSEAGVTDGSVASLQDVRGATVRIVAQGTFIDPEAGAQYNAAGSGSGFFIDPSGIAVTNNHVVTGAAFLQVYVDGEDEPRNARVLGVSECSDLAVIDVDGEGFPYLDWYAGDIAAGTKIFAAGFPLGNEEFTLLDGIVSKEDADGESDWASVDSVIEHSADTLPGSSGGPIVTEDGKVVAVNYAGDSAGQSYGIGRDEALKVIPRLRDGEDVTSLGINGQAITDGTFAGIWVASVASGSPADLAGIEAGDLVTLVEGLIPATDGTMSDYCDILRSHQPTDPLSIEVYRASDDVFLEGTLNTDKPLDVSYSFESTLQDDVSAVTGDPSGGATSYDSYMTITDFTNSMSVEVPSAWTDVDTESLWYVGDEVVGARLSAATDYDAWVNGWSTPGMFFGASTSLAGVYTVDSLLDDQDFSDQCTYDGRTPYSDELYDGAYDVYFNCGGADTLFVVVAAEPPSGAFIMLIQVVVVSDADLEALDAILASFVADEVALAGLTGDTPAAAATSLGQMAFEGLLTGDCFNPVGETIEEVGYGSTVEVFDCAGPHDMEMYAWTVIGDGSGGFPGDDAVSQYADDFCGGEFQPYTGSAYDESYLEYWSYFPTATGWDQGYTFVMCSLDDPSGQMYGSAWQSGW